MLRSRGFPFHSVACDLAARDQVALAAEQVTGRFGAPELVIHNAAIVRRAPLEQTSDAQWDEQLEVNVSAPFRLTRALLPSMKAEGRGRILFVSSISAVVGSACQAPYNASKAALVALMRCLAEELSDTALMAAALLPGAIDTEMLRGSGYPARMTAEEVASTLVYYGLDAPRSHNGAVIEMFGV